MAPRRRQTFGKMERSWRLLIVRSPEDIIDLLAVPVIPPGFYANPADIHNANNNHEDEKLGDRDATSGNLLTASGSSMMIDNKTTNQNKATSLATFPPEILDLIIHNLGTQDVFSVAYTNQRLFNAGLNVLKKRWISPLGRWANTPLISVPEKMKPTDNPVGILTEADLQEIRDGWTEGDEQNDLIESNPMTLFTLANARYERLRKWNDESMEEELCLYTCHHQVPPALVKYTLRCLAYNRGDFYPSDSSWILRNLTAKEYVRSDAVAFQPQLVNGPFIDIMGFGHALLLRVGWMLPDSAHPAGIGWMLPDLGHPAGNDSSSVGAGERRHLGPWAGHRFDITTVDRHQAQTGEAGWKDVSKEVSDEVRRVWQRGAHLGRP
ncbi:MAG: hypothetical protein Q9163_001539 [Psora crenata]